MGKVSVLVQPYASETVVNDIISAAAAISTPGAAQIQRDAAGKLVSVTIHLPDANGVGLQNAADKIQENPGVARTSPFPISASEDFESQGASGSTIISPLPSGILLSAGISSNLWTVASSALAGSKSALCPTTGIMTYLPSNVAQITGYSFRAKLKMTGAGSFLNLPSGYQAGFGPAKLQIFAESGVTTNWKLVNGNSTYDVDLGVPNASTLDILVQYTSFGVDVSVDGGSTWLSNNLPIAPIALLTGLKAYEPGNGTIIMDDVVMSVLEGQLV